MRGLLAQYFRPEKRDQIVSRQKLLDRPDAGIARFQHAILLNAHRQPHTTGPDAFDFANIRNEIFRYVDFQHTHDLAPCIARRYWRLGTHCTEPIGNTAHKFCVAPSCGAVENESAAIFASHNRELVESKSQINLPGAIDNPRAEQREQCCAYRYSPEHRALSSLCAPTSEPSGSPFLFALPDDE